MTRPIDRKGFVRHEGPYYGWALRDLERPRRDTYLFKAGFWGMVAICALIIAAWIVL